MQGIIPGKTVLRDAIALRRQSMFRAMLTRCWLCTCTYAHTIAYNVPAVRACIRAYNVCTYIGSSKYLCNKCVLRPLSPYVHPGTRSAHPRIPGDTTNPCPVRRIICHPLAKCYALCVRMNSTYVNAGAPAGTYMRLMCLLYDVRTHPAINAAYTLPGSIHAFMPNYISRRKIGTHASTSQMFSIISTVSRAILQASSVRTARRATDNNK